MDPAAYVLKEFSVAERKDLPLEVDRCADAVESLIGKGLTAAQNEFHVDPVQGLPGGCLRLSTRTLAGFGLQLRSRLWRIGLPAAEGASVDSG
jgi:hypothetical protein